MVQRILVVALLMLGATSAAQAIQCQLLPDITKGANWSWRLIDGRICWYLGNDDTPRESLRWPESERADPSRPAATQTAERIQCRAQPDQSKPGHWRWRRVDDKQCWFVGDRTIPRELLYWPAQAQAEPAKPVEMPPARIAPPPEETPTDEQPTQLSLWQRQLVLLQINQASDVDLEFVVEGPWIAAPMSFDFNVGGEFLTRVPMTHWPLMVGQSTP